MYEGLEAGGREYLFMINYCSLGVGVGVNPNKKLLGSLKYIRTHKYM